MQALVRCARYRPDVLRQGAQALALLGDREVVPNLLQRLEDAPGLAAQAALLMALAEVGDQRVIEALALMLNDEAHTERAHAFAAVALGMVCDPEPLPWNFALGEGVNFLDAPPTLTDPASGTGVLDSL